MAVVKPWPLIEPRVVNLVNSSNSLSLIAAKKSSVFCVVALLAGRLSVPEVCSSLYALHNFALLLLDVILIVIAEVFVLVISLSSGLNR